MQWRRSCSVWPRRVSRDRGRCGSRRARVPRAISRSFRSSSTARGCRESTGPRCSNGVAMAADRWKRVPLQYTFSSGRDLSRSGRRAGTLGCGDRRPDRRRVPEPAAGRPRAHRTGAARLSCPAARAGPVQRRRPRLRRRLPSSWAPGRPRRALIGNGRVQTDRLHRCSGSNAPSCMSCAASTRVRCASTRTTPPRRCLCRRRRPASSTCTCRSARSCCPFCSFHRVRYNESKTARYFDGAAPRDPPLPREGLPLPATSTWAAARPP